MTFAAVAKHVNREFNVAVTRQVIQQWSKQYAWSQTAKASAGGVAVVVRDVVPATPREQTPTEDVDWDWETKKARFLSMITGMAEDVLAPVVGPAGTPTLMFRDDADRLKAGLALVEMVGKLNSGKFDPPEQGDQLPKLTPELRNSVVNFFITQGRTPMPRVERRGEVVEADFSALED